MSSEVIQHGAWDEDKTLAFRKAFMNFLKYVKINSKETGGGTVLADHIYTAQRIFLDCIFEGLAENIHSFYILKSRQLGISTMSRALSIFWLGMHPGLQGAMVFDTIGHRDEARNEIITMIDELPAKLKFPKKVKDGRDFLSLSNGSTLRFLNAGVSKRKSGGTLGRSSGLNFAHLSEICSFDNDEGMVSFENALSETYPDRLYIYESTARGFNQWYKMWQQAKADRVNKKTCFIGWWAKETQKIAKGTPAFEKYGLASPTPAEQEKIAIVKELYSFDITQEQLAWYRRKTNPAMENVEGEDQEDGMGAIDELVVQEQPFDESESFLQSGSTFFPGDRLTEISKTDVNDKYESYYFTRGQNFLECDFFPLKTRVKNPELRVWEEPDDHGVYIVSADPAFGHSEESDNSCCQVLRAYADCCEQVAEYAHNNIQPQHFAWVISALAGWYKNSYVILELNGPGEAVWVEMKSLKQQVSTGHLAQQAKDKGLRDIFMNVHNFMYARSDSMSSPSVYHWKTTGQNKVLLMERGRDFITDKSLIVRSAGAVSEMRTITRKGDRIAAEGENRDDRFFALALGLRQWEQVTRRVMNTGGRTKAFEMASRRMTLKDQIGLFNKHKLDTFFSQKQNTTKMEQALLRRRNWRGR